LSTNTKLTLFISLGILLFSSGCATTPPKTVPAPKQAPATVTPPKQTPEPQAAAPVPQKPEAEKAPSEPVAPPIQTPEPRSTVPSPTQPERQAPRATAALRLTEQARLLIESKRPDDAISTLEKAVNIDSNNGQNYYLLAEAWMMKGNQKQASQFNRIAGTYLNDDAGWKVKVQQQKERIQKMPGAR
jgi:hypothetical protein